MHKAESVEYSFLKELHPVPVRLWFKTFKKVVAAVLQQTVDVQRDEELGSQWISIQVRGQRKRNLQHRDQQEAAGCCLPVPPLNHLKEHCSSHSHPVQLDLKGRVKGEVSVVITAAPLGSVTAVVNVHIQSDGLLLWDCSRWGTDRGRERGGETGRQEAKEAKEGKMGGMMGRQRKEQEQVVSMD